MHYLLFFIDYMIYLVKNRRMQCRKGGKNDADVFFDLVRRR